MASTSGKAPQLYVPQQKITFDLRVCGKLCECRETWNWNQSARPARGDCHEPFSKASRLRLLKEIAQIRWPDDIRYSLITLTYPDQVAERSIARQTIDRSRFIRDLEHRTGREYGLLWRKEWEPRKSGVNAGNLTAHWHLLCWNTSWIDHKDIRKLWSTVLATGGPCATDIREAKTGEAAAFYAAKYAAKPSSCSLDNVSYLNRQYGRPWGFCRKVLISYHDPVIIRDLSPDEFALAKHLAAAQWKGVARGADQGFTLFGDCGLAIVNSVRKMRVARKRASG